MSKKEIGSIPQVAQKLINHLPNAMDDELKRLITRAEAGQNVTTEIVNFFAKHETTRTWLKEQLNLQSREMGGIAGYEPLAGNSNMHVPISQKWICSNKSCSHWILMIQVGEDPPICKEHKIAMVDERKNN